MKVSDGNWLVQETLDILSPLYVHEIQIHEKELVAFVTPRNVELREDQLDVSLFTYRFFSPMSGVIGVRIEHFKGIYPTKPHFKLHFDNHCIVQCSNKANQATLQTGQLSLSISKSENWKIKFLHNDKQITCSNVKSSGYAKNLTTKQTYMYERLDLQVGETVYGLGEHFTAFVKNGQIIETWNRDGGTSTEQAYKNIPFYLTNHGYGVFVNHPELVSLEIASEKVSKVQFNVPGESLEYYIIDGPTPKEVLERYTLLTGRPSLPPAWSFGLWLTTSFTTSYDEQTVNSFVNGMKQRSLTLHVFHFDCFWMKAFHWCNFEWDSTVFPDPQGMIQRLKAKGLKICVWINPYISQQSALFPEGMENSYFLKNKEGNIWQWDKWQPGQAIVDFTNPAACRWYSGYLERLVDMGIDCFKTDFGERIPTDVTYYDGSDPQKMHNYYTYLFNKTVFDLLQSKKGSRNTVLFARSATVGSQSFPVHWGGDCYATFESMAESLRGGLSLSLSGFGFWSHDIGGFENTASAHVYKRWCAFGLLSSHSRLHGSKSYRVPWLYDEEAVDVLRFFTNWKCRLMPYLYAIAVVAAKRGLPVMRAMWLEFPQDPGCEYLDRQYMLGDSVLVAPIFNDAGTVSFYLPSGCWTHLFSNEELAGGTWHKETHDFFSLPVYVRENTLLPIGANQERPDYEYIDQLELHLFALQNGHTATTTIYNLEGTAALTAIVTRQRNTLYASFTGITKPCFLILRGKYLPVTSLSGECIGEQENLGVRIRLKPGTKELQIIL
ncbi:Alpha-xylosidase [Propionispora sp. 2/2-37]|uniref:alpha-xylosidase n=1 Tax=Propionispora sp. 2/2-37 TaxID=1677858 RepID=UPI0006BB6C6F|nr:alpha-xylosidase [Propionispora sp. 2/2-37]CUH96875.1 Alpha-xylosidase [Propionispora sp. 2/2-37]